MHRLYNLTSDLLLSEATAAKLNAAAKHMLIEGCEAFHEAGLAKDSVIEADGDVIVFPWRGQRHLNGIIAMLRACMLAAIRAGPAIVILNKNRIEVAAAVSERWPKYENLPSHELVRGFVQSARGKFDDVLTPLFWRHDFVSDGLSVRLISEIVRKLVSKES